MRIFAFRVTGAAEERPAGAGADRHRRAALVALVVGQDRRGLGLALGRDRFECLGNFGRELAGGFAFWIAGTREEKAPERLFQRHRFAALGAFGVGDEFGNGFRQHDLGFRLRDDFPVRRPLERHGIATFRIGAAREKFAAPPAFDDHRAVALGAGHSGLRAGIGLDRALIVARKVHRALAVGVAGTGEEFAVATRLDRHWLAAFLADNAGIHRAQRNDLVFLVAREIRRGLALGILRAREEFALLAHAQNHFGATFLTDDARLYRFNDLNVTVLAREVAGEFALRILRAGQVLAPAPLGDVEFALLAFGTFQLGRNLLLFQRRIKHRLKIIIELLQQRVPLDFAGLDLVELSLHLGGELHIEQLRKGFHQQIVRLLADIGGLELVFLLLDVLAVENCFHRRRIRTRPTDAEFFQRLDQGRLGITRQRDGEMLFGP